MEMKPIMVEELTVRELEHLEKSTSLSYDDLRPVNVCAEAVVGKALIWRYRGDEGENGILVTRIIQRVGGLEMSVDHLTGTGLARNGKFIFEEMEELAKKQGCRWMVGLCTDHVAGWLCDYLGFEKRSILVSKEI